MKFKELLEEYLFRMDINKDALSRPNLSDYRKGYMFGQRRAHMTWFQIMKPFCEDFAPEIRECTEEEIARFVTEKDTDLIGVIEYRDDIIPVYNDDNGQCYYTIIKGQTFGGETFNNDIVYEFCDIYDSIIDQLLTL